MKKRTTTITKKTTQTSNRELTSVSFCRLTLSSASSGSEKTYFCAFVVSRPTDHYIHTDTKKAGNIFRPVQMISFDSVAKYKCRNEKLLFSAGDKAIEEKNTLHQAAPEYTIYIYNTYIFIEYI